eukprot:6907765-Pyramimonas_sp.AAC.1
MTRSSDVGGRRGPRRGLRDGLERGGGRRARAGQGSGRGRCLLRQQAGSAEPKCSQGRLPTGCAERGRGASWREACARTIWGQGSCRNKE